jgi:hypothetical protein
VRRRRLDRLLEFLECEDKNPRVIGSLQLVTRLLSGVFSQNGEPVLRVFEVFHHTSCMRIPSLA